MPAAKPPAAPSAGKPAEPSRRLETSRPTFIGHRPALEIGMGVTISALLLSGNAMGQVSRTGFSPDAGYAPYNHTADVVSDFTGAAVGAVTALAAGSALEAVHLGRGSAAKQFYWSTMVALEAWLLSTSATLFLKKSIGRCRPLAWDEQNEQCDPTLPARDPQSTFFSGDTAYRAMPSGHVTGISGISGAYFWMAITSPEKAPLRWVAFGATQALAWTTAALRVESGVHSWTDTIVAWGVGSTIGLAVGALHPRVETGTRTKAVWLTPLGAGLALQGKF